MARLLRKRLSQRWKEVIIICLAIGSAAPAGVTMAFLSPTPNFFPRTVNSVSTSQRRPHVALYFKGEEDEVEAGTVIFSDGKLPFADIVNNNCIINPRAEILFTLLVLFSSLFTAIETLPSVSPDMMEVIYKFSKLFTYAFAIEFVLRFWATFRTNEPLYRYTFRPLVVVDFIVVILPLLLPAMDGSAATIAGIIFPTWITSSSTLVNLRLLRILRLQRILEDMDTFAAFEEALGFPRGAIRPWQLQLARVLLTIFTLISVSTGLIYAAEHEANPAIPDYFTALYFGLTTLTTVGFGDITPITAEGRIVVCGSILAGVTIIPLQAASLVDALLDFQKERKQNKEQLKEAVEPPQQLPIKAGLHTGGVEQVVGEDDISRNLIKLPSGGMLDASRGCKKCQASFHWMGASFCWSCGEQFEG